MDQVPSTPGKTLGFCPDKTRCSMLGDQKPSQLIASPERLSWSNQGPRLQRQEFETQPGLLDPNAVGHSGPRNAQGDDLEDEVALRGVVAIDIRWYLEIANGAWQGM